MAITMMHRMLLGQAEAVEHGGFFSAGDIVQKFPIPNETHGRVDEVAGYLVQLEDEGMLTGLTIAGRSPSDASYAITDKGRLALFPHVGVLRALSTETIQKRLGAAQAELRTSPADVGLVHTVATYRAELANRGVELPDLD